MHKYVIYRVVFMTNVDNLSSLSTEDDQPLYVNMTELANMAYEKQQREQNSGDETPTAKAPPTSMTQVCVLARVIDRKCSLNMCQINPLSLESLGK